MSEANETESEPDESRVVFDPQVLRNLHVALVLMFVQYAAMIALAYVRLRYAADDIASSHRFTAMALIAVAPGVLIWREPRWRRIGLWFLWALAIFTWGVMRVESSPHHQDPWERDLPPLLAMKMLVISIFFTYVALLGIAARARREHGPSARIHKR